MNVKKQKENKGIKILVKILEEKVKQAKMKIRK